MSDIGQSVNQFIVETQRAHPSATGDLTGLLNDVISACKKIANLVNRSSILGLEGYANSNNVQGEHQKKLDILTNDVMVEHLNWTGHLAAMVSEEIDDIITISDDYPKGKYLLCFDPLDGSSNIDINLSVGTIFSVLRCPEGIENPSHEHFLQKGKEQVCAGFCVYGPSTMLILTTGFGVNGFTLDREVGEFILTHPDMQIPEDTSEFAINMSNQRYWEPPVKRYIDECIQGVDGVREKNFNMRWNASMVAEVYRILTRGGIFMYPLDSRIAQQGGKLRLLYEANPMSFIIEQAGGASSTGRERILSLQPESIHQRVPVILGSKHEVERLESYHL
ncbi:MAG: class 1 fructose-bisphosphatase [Methylophaga sp.]|uniref:Fructose-1,6-bisphosphatase class 1 n=1 Tax=Methylophaga marina TaxID=45495 RepID=A0ABN0TWE2_9GAMM|nr:MULTISPECIES: class 1 fructose-bisphosphatase [Methylophaga]MAX53778.1 class 1 fructose-bisphosphatase [Methylophaga sp.]BDZ73776.1 fructose-1,6-bisphosphatase class 1 [Methylophaga marina]|tara:strand:- start:65770 stop:66774 length:1005 start_codon:yes stop_codon:yes gene_type:complete